MIEVERADRIDGPLVVVEGFGGAAYGELVEVHTPRGTHLGEVLSAGSDAAVVELWGDTTGLRAADVRVRFHGETLHLGVAREMLGRVFDGLGRPRDGLPPPVAEARRDVHGAPLNPAARAYPQDVILTGVSAIDGLNTLVRGQKLPIFSGAGLPHDDLASQIALQAHLATRTVGDADEEAARGDAGEDFAVIFAALGISHDTASYFRDRFAASGMLGRTALFLNLADDPPMERIVTPRAALTLAEYLAFEQGTHVLVLMTDMTNYAEALRELSARKNEVPGRKGYPGYLYTDLASLYERCGRVHGGKGSLTQIPVLSMPGDDITHPIPDLTGYITEGQVVLSRALDRAGVYPPVDVLASLSRLMKDGIGSGRTREDHAEVAAEAFAAYARVREVRSLALIIGERSLSTTDRTYLAFGEAFEQSFLAQGAAEARSLEATLDLLWDALSRLPAGELRRVSEEQLAKHYSGKLEGPAHATG
ncbi:MAG: V-type ATP synthase subunit B [Trueperaceae bacterium]